MHLVGKYPVSHAGLIPRALGMVFVYLYSVFLLNQSTLSTFNSSQSVSHFEQASSTEWTLPTQKTCFKKVSIDSST